MPLSASLFLSFLPNNRDIKPPDLSSVAGVVAGVVTGVVVAGVDDVLEGTVVAIVCAERDVVICSPVISCGGGTETDKKCMSTVLQDQVFFT